MKIIKPVNNFYFALTLLFQMLATINCYAQDNLKDFYLKEAKNLIPTLSHQTIFPVRAIKIENDLQVWLGWNAITVSSESELTTIKLAKGDTHGRQKYSTCKIFSK